MRNLLILTALLLTFTASVQAQDLSVAEIVLKQNLNDPTSYQKISWTKYTNNLGKSTHGKDMILPSTWSVYGLKYRAKNAFGGIIVDEQRFLFNDKGFLFYKNGIVWRPEVRGDFGTLIAPASPPGDLRIRKW